MFKSLSAIRWRDDWLRCWPWVAIPVLAIPACWTYTGGFPGTADGVNHLLRTVLLDINIRQGVIFPRWVPQLVLGYGYPVFNFYGPTTYYLAEGLHLLGLGYYQAVDAAFVVMIIGAGYGMYLLAGAVLDAQASAWPALVAAAAYMYAPYLLTNVFIRAALGEVGAQALLPWIFWSFNRLIKHPQPGRWLLPAALSLGGLAATHDITLLFLPPALVAYGVVLWWRAGRDRRRLAWAAAGVVAAMAVGAFFWVPLISERQYLSRTAYAIARQFLAENAWTWSNFLDDTLAFGYTFAIPFELGLIQLILAVVGFLLARRRDAEWLYWLLLTVVACLGMGAWAIPIWQSNDFLLTAQFEWRLLTLVSVALALFMGGTLSRVRSQLWQAAGGIGLLAVIILANTPRIHPANLSPLDNAEMGLANVAQFEAITGEAGTSAAQEFMPLWVQSRTLAAAAGVSAIPAPDLNLRQASPYERVFQASSSDGFELHFNVFYFPGWRVYLDGNQPLADYPSTNMGLLTIRVPPGTHEVRLVWQGTAVAAWATYATLAALLLLAAVQWTQPRRWLAALPLALLVFGAVVTFNPLPRPEAVKQPAEPFVTAGLRMLGFRTAQPSPNELYLYPYWQVYARPASRRAYWRLTNAGGQIISELATKPYFGTSQSDNWPANTLVDDAYRLPLPPGMPAGNYDLWLALEPFDAPTASGPANLAHIANLALAAGPEAQAPPVSQALNARFGQNIILTGYNIGLNSKFVTGSRLVVRPGDELDYTLYWRALGVVPENYNGLIHLLNANGQTLIKVDQLPWSWVRPPIPWDRFDSQADTYRMNVPNDAPGGLYWPRVGLIHFPTQEQLLIQDAAGQVIGSSLDLPPVKIVPPTPRPPEHLTSVGFGELALLWGYNLNLPPAGLRPGDTFTLTLYYRSTAPSSIDYTHFVHMFAADGRLVAQNDAQPQQGVNPTSAWVPGEVIVDPIVLTVAPDALAGTYSLRTGLYYLATGERVPLYAADGQPVPDNSAALAQLTVQGH